MAEFVIIADSIFEAPYRVHRTTDGVSWTAVDVSMKTRGIVVLDTTKAVIAGTNIAGDTFEMKFTADGGLTWNVPGGDWSTRTYVDGRPYHSISKVSDTEIYISAFSNSPSQETVVLYSNDAGATFNIHSTPTLTAQVPGFPTKHLAAIVAFDNDHWWGISRSTPTSPPGSGDGDGDWFSSNDGGATWVNEFNSSGQWQKALRNSVVGPTQLDIWFAGGNTKMNRLCCGEGLTSDLDPFTVDVPPTVHPGYGGGGGNKIASLFPITYNEWLITDYNHKVYSTQITGANEISTTEITALPQGNTLDGARNVAGYDAENFYVANKSNIYYTNDGGSTFNLVYTKDGTGGDFMDDIGTDFFITGQDYLREDMFVALADSPQGYLLEDCAGLADDIVTTYDFSAEVGKVVKVNGINVCYQVSLHTSIVGAIEITSVDSVANDCGSCSTAILGCINPNAYNYDTGADTDDGSCLFAYRLTDTKGREADIVTITDLSAYVGLVIKLVGQEVCWSVAYETDITGETLTPVTYDSDYADAPTCELTLPTGYRLTDISGGAPDILTLDDLSSYVGLVIRVNGERVCRTVVAEADPIDPVSVTVYSNYADNDACLLSLEPADSDCPPEEEEVPVPEPAPTPKPLGNLNSYYQKKYRLDQIVREFIIERGEETEHSYPRLLQLAINGLREINMDVSGHSKIVVLTIKDDMTVDLPDDFISYTKIGICGADGNTYSLGWNNAMCLPRHSDECGNVVYGGTSRQSIANYSQSDLGFGFIGVNNFSEGLSDNFRNGELTGRFYGLGGGNSSLGYYRIDKQRGVIQLSTSMNHTEIVLEYMADIQKIDGSYMVHPYIIETIKAFMAWASIRRKRNIPLQEVQMARGDYYNERRISKERFQSFTMDEAKQMIRKAFKLSPKM